MDGYDAQENRIYEMNGCWFHGHQCHLTKKIRNEEWLKTRAQKYAQTMKREEYLRNEGYNLTVK